MILGRFSTRSVLLICAGSLTCIVVGGGALLALVEGTSILSGIWLAFNIVSTTGFGNGPATTLGQIVSMVIFFMAVSCWFGVAVVAMEIGNIRSQNHSLIDAGVRPSERQSHDRLFHLN